MKRFILPALLLLSAFPALAAEHEIRMISDPAGKKPYYFEPDNLTINPGDTVTFINAQEDTHDVMFVETPKKVKEMIMSQPMEQEGARFSYTFTIPGTYKFHCHPHEQLGMNGTLIVGRASAPGENKVMDHHAMPTHATGGQETVTPAHHHQH